MREKLVPINHVETISIHTWAQNFYARVSTPPPPPPNLLNWCILNIRIYTLATTIAIKMRWNAKLVLKLLELPERVCKRRAVPRMQSKSVLWIAESTGCQQLHMDIPMVKNVADKAKEKKKKRTNNDKCLNYFLMFESCDN